MKVLVCGDRNWTDKEAVRSWLDKLQDWGYDTVIEGEARGADTIAREIAEELGMQVLNRDCNTRGFPAQWTKYGKSAGPIRNREMLDRKPDLVLAFHADLSKSRGTADTVREAKRRGIETIIEDGKERR